MSKPKKLKPLKDEQLKEYIENESDLQKIKEPSFSLGGSIQETKTTPLVELEIAYRKCEENGIFS